MDDMELHWISEISGNDEYKKFRELCKELSKEGHRLNLPSDIMFSGVCWDGHNFILNKLYNKFFK